MRIVVMGNWKILMFSSLLILGACEQGDDAPDSTSEENNLPVPIGPLVINEVVAKATDGGPDWVELYNRGDADISLDGFTLKDDKEDNVFVFPDSLTISPGEFFVIEGKNSADTVFFPFGLSSDEAVRLIGADGALVDKLDWNDEEAPEGQSYGRYPDGGDVVGTLEFPTYGTSNAPLL